MSIVPSPPSPSLNAAIELIGSLNEAGIFVGDILVIALINMGEQISIITQEFCEQHG